MGEGDVVGDWMYWSETALPPQSLMYYGGLNMFKPMLAIPLLLAQRDVEIELK